MTIQAIKTSPSLESRAEPYTEFRSLNGVASANSSGAITSVVHGRPENPVLSEKTLHEIEECLAADDSDSSPKHHSFLTRILFKHSFEKADTKQRSRAKEINESFARVSLFVVVKCIHDNNERGLQEHLHRLKKEKLISPENFARLTAVIHANTDMDVL